MSPAVVVSLGLIAVFGLGLLIAAWFGHAMPTPVILSLVILGPAVVVAPTLFSFLVQVVGRQPQFTEDERITCWILGGVMTMIGIVAASVPVRRRDRAKAVEGSVGTRG